MQRRAEGGEIFVLLRDLRVARQAVGEQRHHVVGGGIAVHADHVEGILHVGGERLLQHGGRNGGVGGDEDEHGRHIGVDHAHALADGADAALFAAQHKAVGDLLFDGVGGHDALRRLVAMFAQPCRQGGHARRDGLERERLADDARGGDDDVCRRHARILFHEGAHALRDLDAVRVAGVGVAAVAHHRPRIAVGDVFFGDEDGRALDEVLRIDARSRAAHVADDQR